MAKFNFKRIVVCVALLVVPMVVSGCNDGTLSVPSNPVQKVVCSVFPNNNQPVSCK